MRSELSPVLVMTVKAEGGTRGANEAFELLRSKLPTMRGRRFYGIYYPSTGEYRACVEKKQGERAESYGLEAWTIPGGAYLTRKVDDWDSKLSEMPKMFEELVGNDTVDRTRPSVEFYRSQRELVLYMPVI